MQPIVTINLPVILSKPIDHQLLTLYLIRSNSVNKEPYDPNYAKRTRKRSESPSSIERSKKKKKSTKSSTSNKDETPKSVKSDQVKKSKSKPDPETKKSSKSKSSSSSTTSSLKVSRKSGGTGGDGKSTSQVLSVPSTSKAPSNQYKGINKITPPKRKRFNGHSSSSKSTPGTPSTSKSDSTTPRTPLKVNQLNHSSPSNPKVKKQPPISVPEPFRHFKIPKRAKNSHDDKVEMPKRLQPSGRSPVDLIIGQNRVGPSRQNIQSENGEDFDALEEAEPELGFDLYGGEESLSQPPDDFTRECNEPSIRQEDGQREDASTSNEWCQDDPMDQTLPPVPSPTVLKQLDDESESSDDECNFKRRRSRKGQKSERIVTMNTEPKINSSSKVSTTRTETRLKPVIPLKSETKSKVISLRPSSSTPRPPIPPSLSPRPNLPPSPSHLTSPSQPPPPPPSSSLSTSSAHSPPTTVQSLITEVLNIQSTHEAMKTFIGYSYSYSKIFTSDPQSFQTLFRTLLLNLLFDTNFTMNEKRFGVLLKMMRQLGMDESHHWEKIICSWGRQYKSLLPNEAKLENIIKVTEWILDHLQSNKIPINLPTAELLYSMHMVKNVDH